MVLPLLALLIVYCDGDLVVTSYQHLVTGIREHAHYSCVECHGLDGHSPITDMYDKQSPILAGQHFEYLKRQLQAFKSGLRKTAEMNGVLQDYSQEEIEQIARYFSLQSLQINDKLDPTIDTLTHSLSEDFVWAADGRRIFHQGDVSRGIEACQTCHGRHGEGNDKLGSPALTAQHARYTRMTLHAYKNGERSTDNDLNSVMQNISKALNETDIRNLAAYIQGLTTRCDTNMRSKSK